jgi:hypothetical protein
MAHKNEEHTSFAVLDFDQKMKKISAVNLVIKTLDPH